MSDERLDAIERVLALKPGDEIDGVVVARKAVSNGCFGWWLAGEGNFVSLNNLIAQVRPDKTGPRSEAAALRRRLSEASEREAVLEEITKEGCAFEGSYNDCFEAMENDDPEAEDHACAKCLATRALTSTPAPALDPATVEACARIVEEVTGCKTCLGCGDRGHIKGRKAAARIRALAHVEPTPPAESLAPSGAAAVTPVCASWCGTTLIDSTSWTRVIDDALYAFCSEACRDAGKPLHPREPGDTRRGR